MLTKRQNFLETIRGGNPDRYVNQYEYLALFRQTPLIDRYPFAQPGQDGYVGAWGITWRYPEGVPGFFPDHRPEKIVIKDIENWREYIQEPELIYPPEAWEKVVAQANQVDRNEQFCAAFVNPGIFEQCHHLMEIQNCLMAFYEYPDKMHELIDYLTDWELRYAEQICYYIKPDALFHHDDWGSQTSTFISPEMWREFIKPAYKKIYGYYKEHGVEIIVHHSDSYAATLVPDMIDVGIDVWQGAMNTNNIPKLLEEYGDRIAIMGGIDSADVDRPDWTPDMVTKVVREACESCGKKSFIPCNSSGLPKTIYPGVYDAITEAIDTLSREHF